MNYIVLNIFHKKFTKGSLGSIILLIHNDIALMGKETVNLTIMIILCLKWLNSFRNFYDYTIVWAKKHNGLFFKNLNLLERILEYYFGLKFWAKYLIGGSYTFSSY